MKEYRFKINGRNYEVAVKGIDGGKADVTVNGVSYSVDIEDGAASPAFAAAEASRQFPPTTPSLRSGPTVPQSSTVPPLTVPRVARSLAGTPGTPGAHAAKAGGTVVKSPLPGVIIELNVREGQPVKAGQKIAVLEAMKMENEIQATSEGTIRTIHVQRGDSVLEGADLFTID